MYKLILIIFPFIILGCSESEIQSINLNIKAKEKYTEETKHVNKTDDLIRIKNHEFIRNILLKNTIEIDLEKYDLEDCNPIPFYIEAEKDSFEEPIDFGKVFLDRKHILTFVLGPLNFCEEGDSYYFSDTSIPRLYTDSECCHPNNLFNVGDIDEDGISELGQYYSSCSSRYKTLNIYTLKKDEWVCVGSCFYDLGYTKYEPENFHKFVRKIGKGQFEMLEITDLGDKDFIGKANWIKFKI